MFLYLQILIQDKCRQPYHMTSPRHSWLDQRWTLSQGSQAKAGRRQKTQPGPPKMSWVKQDLSLSWEERMKRHQWSSAEKITCSRVGLDKVLGNQCLSETRKQTPQGSRSSELEKRCEHRPFDRRKRCTGRNREWGRKGDGASPLTCLMLTVF